jgi:dephospho-CoA kinase
MRINDRDERSSPSTLVGLTGGIGAGKSTVARLFAAYGAAIIDADALAREVLAPGTNTLREVVAIFGTEVLDARGELDRARLGRIVFADSRAREALEAITHPAIIAAAKERIDTLIRAGHRQVIYEAALLIESGRDAEMDLLVVVIADDEIRIRRLKERCGMSRSEVLQRFSAQLPQAEKAARADYLIDNSGSLEQTRTRVREVWSEIQRMADSGQEER